MRGLSNPGKVNNSANSIVGGSTVTNHRSNAAYFGCEIFQAQIIPKSHALSNDALLINWNERIANSISGAVLKWSNQNFTNEDVDYPDNAIPEHFYPFFGNKENIAYKDTRDYVTQPNTDLRLQDKNWFSPFRLLQIDLEELENHLTGSNNAMHFECNAYCDNCLYTEFRDGGMKYPSYIDNKSAVKSQM